MTTPSDLPSYRRPELTKVMPDLQLIDDILGGTRVVHQYANTRRYLRKWRNETREVYEMRSTCETVFEGLARVLSASIGLMFQKPPTLTWNGSTAIEPHWQDLNLAGDHGNVLVKEFAELCLGHGLGAIVVDYTQRDASVVTLADEQARNVRPKWALYTRSSILSWRIQKINNAARLTQIVFHEPTDINEGAFGTTTENRYRVLELVNDVATWRVYRQREGGTEPQHFEKLSEGTFANREGKQLTGRLPVAIGYGGRKSAPLVAAPPLLGVAWANLAHWRVSTDLRFAEMVAAYAQPTVRGALIGPDGQPSNSLPLGPLVAVRTAADGAFSWTEPEGTSFQQLAKSRQEKLEEMGRMGISFLAGDKRAAETAEAKKLNSAAEFATLSTAAQGIEDAVNLALELHAWFEGIARDQAPTMALTRDFAPLGPDAPLLTAFAALVKAGFPKMPIAQFCVTIGLIPADTDLDEFVLEWDANEGAQSEAARFTPIAEAA